MVHSHRTQLRLPMVRKRCVFILRIPLPSKFLYVLLVLLAFHVAGCSGLPSRYKSEDEKYLPHYLFVDRDGHAKRTDGSGMHKLALQEHLDKHFFKDIGDRMQALRSQCKADRCPPLQLLIYIHGGMNGYNAAFDRMQRLLHHDAHDATPKGLLNPHNTSYYPFFINWNSEPIDSMVDDLFNIRFGERQSLAVTVPTMPFVLLGRLAGSVGSVPVSLAAMGSNIQESFAGAIEQGDGVGCALADAMAYAPVFPLYAVTAPLLEGFGTPAWATMKRRAELAVESRLPAESKSSEGAVRTVFNAMIRHLKAKTEDGGPIIPVEITLVGHSMGTMILNRLLPLIDTSQHITVKHIVYMAAAAPIDELDQMVVPFLERHQEATLWIFNLNRRDEAREIALGGYIFFMPRGTLLAWIDTFFEPSMTIGQMTQGRVENMNTFYRCDLTANGDEAPGCPPEATSKPLALSSRRAVPFSGFIERQITHNAPFPLHQVRLFETSRELGHNNAPETHGDFSQSRYLGQVLCQVDATALEQSICQKRLRDFDPPLREERNIRACGVFTPFRRVN